MAKRAPKEKKAAPRKSSAAVRPAKSPAKAAAGVVYPVKITLADVRPPIWRRVQVKDCTLADLHRVIQIAMGWDDEHLHLFKIGDERYGSLDQWEGDMGDEDVQNEARVKLSRLVGAGVKKIRYEYDMGDGWSHTIQIEKTLPAEAGVRYPRCVGGARACPPEDCGGPWGYGDLLDALADPKHPEHEDMEEWVGGGFDPEAFDLEAVNRRLAR